MSGDSVCPKKIFPATDKASAVITSYSIHYTKLYECPYHRMVHLDSSAQWQVTTKCCKVDEMVHRSWFVLPPVMEWYYKRRNLMYRTLPPWKPGCTEEIQRVMEMIYPRENNQVFLPVQLDGTLGQVVLEAAHSSPDVV